MTDPTPIALSPDMDPWERQPGETVTRHNQFCVYRDEGRTRTLRKAAENLAKSPAYIRQVAAAGKWVQRAEAWDLHRDKLDEQAWLEERRKAREVDARVLSAALGKVAQRLPSLRAEDLSAADVTRLLDVTLRHRRSLFGDPDTTVHLTTGSDSGTLPQLAEFLQMPPDRRRATLAALADSVRQRVDAVDDTGTDDG